MFLNFGAGVETVPMSGNTSRQQANTLTAFNGPLRESKSYPKLILWFSLEIIHLRTIPKE